MGLLDLSMRCFSLLLLFRTRMYLWLVFVSWGRCSLKCLSEAGSNKKEEDEACTGLLKACNCRCMCCLCTGHYYASPLLGHPPVNPAGCFVYSIIPQFLVMLEFSGCLQLSLDPWLFWLTASRGSHCRLSRPCGLFEKKRKKESERTHKHGVEI